MLGNFSYRLRNVKPYVRDWVFGQLEEARSDNTVIEFVCSLSVYFVNEEDSVDAHHKLFILAKLLNFLSEDVLQPLLVKVDFA